MRQFEHLDLYRTLREKWVHEDHVVNHRLTWLILSQAMLMGAYGWSLASKLPKTEKLLVLIPVFGIVFTVAIGASVLTSVIAQNRLAYFPGASEWPQPYSVGTYTPINWFGRLAALTLPFFLFIVWLVVLVA
jgi:hypothetical protein